MKRLLLLLLIPLLFIPMSAEAATKTLNSYSNVARTVAQDNFTTSIVYMKTTGFAGGSVYRTIFWDGAGNNVDQQDLTGATLNANATLQHLFVPANTPGLWHVAIYKAGSAPVNYIASDSNIVADDTSYSGSSFTVQASAIPEFETVFAAVWVVFICGLTYWLMKKRRR